MFLTCFDVDDTSTLDVFFRIVGRELGVCCKRSTNLCDYVFDTANRSVWASMSHRMINIFEVRRYLAGWQSGFSSERWFSDEDGSGNEQMALDERERIILPRHFDPTVPNRRRRHGRSYTPHPPAHGLDSACKKGD